MWVTGSASRFPGLAVPSGCTHTVRGTSTHTLISMGCNPQHTRAVQALQHAPEGEDVLTPVINIFTSLCFSWEETLTLRAKAFVRLPFLAHSLLLKHITGELMGREAYRKHTESLQACGYMSVTLNRS